MNNTKIGKQAQDAMIRGIKVATTAIRPTYGHNGVNAVIEHTLYPYHEVANDAQTIIQAIHVTDKYEKQGLDFLKELSDKQNSTSGDGRKTTCIMAETILDEGFKSELKGIALKRELDSLIPLVESKIDHYKQDIGLDDIHKVATIAGESEEIGHLIGYIYKNIGKDGVINVESSGTYDNHVQYVNGVRFFDTGYLSPYFVHESGSTKDENGFECKDGKRLTRAVYENPAILVTRQKMTKDNINDLLSKMITSKWNDGKKDLVIFTDNMDSSVVSMVINTHKSGNFNLLIIKAPTIFKNYVFEDFAKVTGAVVIDDSTGTSLSKLRLDYLGTCDKLIVEKGETIVIGIADISNHIEELKKENTNDSKLRLQWLNTNTAFLRLGANNESELSYKRLKCVDAVNASRLALQDGVVKGGGITLHEIAGEMPDTIAGRIMENALNAPLYQIMENSNMQEFDIPETFGDNVLDASLVTKNAVRNAISLASIILTTGVTVVIPERSQEQIMADNMQSGKMKF